MEKIHNEYDYLIHLIKCAITHKIPQELPNDLSFDKVYEYGISHDIANIAFYSIEKLSQKPQEDLYKQWQLCRDLAFTRDINQSFARDEIVSLLQSENIRFLELQGTKIKEFYPSPDYRTMSDIDFIIDLENLEKGRKILEDLGYMCKNVDNVEIDGFRSPNINIELHTEYFSENSNYHQIMRPPFETLEEKGEYDVNEFYIYNMLHIAKHYFNKGCGIRRVLDAYYLNLNYSKIINHQYVNSYFEKANILEFVERISNLAKYWFGNGEYSQEFDSMAKYITHSPLHGTEQNEMNNRLRDVCGEDTKFPRIRYAFKRVFAVGGTMYKHYPFLKKWKILYPFCWIHRFIRFLLNPKANGALDEVMLLRNAKNEKI